MNRRYPSSRLAGIFNRSHNKRKNTRVKTAIFEIKGIIDDIRSQWNCGAVGVLDRWELWVLPMLLNNSGTWIKRNESTLDMLDELQHMIVNTCHTRPHLKISAQLALIWRMGHEWYYYPNSYPPTRHPATRPTALVENWDTSATTWEILL